MNRILLKFYIYTYYFTIRIHNLVKKRFGLKLTNKFLFILSPPYCGSTLLNEIISTSKKVSTNNSLGTREGQQLPGVRKIMFDHNRRWDNTLDFDWEYIKKEWMRYWDITRPILLEKSPPNIIRACFIKKTFKRSYFVIFFRNPYAHCESLIRRHGFSAEYAATFAIQCLRYQYDNIKNLDNSIKISYESLTKNPEEEIKRIQKLLPELDDINFDKEFNAHNYKNRNLKIIDLNPDKISKLNKDQKSEINKIFARETDILTYFGYPIIK